MLLPSLRGPDDVVIELPQIGARIDRWKSYTVDSNFLTPSDGWSFTLGDDLVSDDLLKRLDVGLRVNMTVNGARQLAGYIDDITVRGTREGGTEVELHGRDLLAPVVDGCLDPAIHFTPGMTLGDVLERIFTGYGFTTVVDDNEENIGVLTGTTRGQHYTKARVGKRKTTGGKPFKKEAEHLLKPYTNEGAFAFAARVAQRHALWIWLGALDGTIIVSQPNFTQAPMYQLRRLRGDGSQYNNVLSGEYTRSAAEQPSCIVATGRQGGGTQDYSAMRVVAINGLIQANVEAIKKRYGPQVVARKNQVVSRDVTYDDPVMVELPGGDMVPAAGPPGLANVAYPTPRAAPGAGFGPSLLPAGAVQPAYGPELQYSEFLAGPVFETLRTRYPGASFIVVNAEHPTKYKVDYARALYLQDDTANTLDRLKYFALRELALRQRKAFTAHYTVEGHTGTDADGNEAIWQVDTMVDVQDEITGLFEPLYVLGRTFRKSRSGGTVTDLQLIKPNSMVFG